MTQKNTTALPVAVLGAGSFGTSIANILAQNSDVLLYTRRPELRDQINATHQHLSIALSPRITATCDLAFIAASCTVIFPIVPSVSFRSLMREIAPYLRPYHLIIHGTKGFDTTVPVEPTQKLSRSDVHTMSEVIAQETSVVRIGCLSGPNLSAEILQGQPSATVIASRFNEVIKLGQTLLTTKTFQVFGSHEITGAELAGAMKNTIAIGAGILGGKGLGYNIWALLITRGLNEMITVGSAMGANPKAFLGVAGIGDLIATASGKLSRNYQIGYRIAQGETLAEVQASMNEVAEGVRTTKIIKEIAKYYRVHVPIVQAIYAVLYENASIDKNIDFLMKFPYASDVDFM